VSIVRRVLVGDQERALVIRRGRFERMLGPGSYWIFGLGVVVEQETIAPAPEFVSEWSPFLVKERAALLSTWFTAVETGDAEVAAVWFDGKLTRLIGPGRRVLYWRGSIEVTAKVYDTRVSPEAPAELVAPLARLGKEAAGLLVRAEVASGAVGLLYADGRFERTLEPGAYAFWAIRNIRVEQIDLRLQALEIPGQEILTRDKVSIRVNVSAEYRVTDPALAALAVQGWQAYLYRTVQFAVRQLLGVRTLDELLADKALLEQAQPALGEVRAAMEPLGVQVSRLAFKDVILPGEMREMLNQVVLAEKEAQANLIRRREETAATRSLVNTARLMQENPLVVRLKELETLEKVAGKVGKISIYSGVDGLMRNLVSLREVGE
jgi:regulator of protease activity HflC (stomatin/prohibitin superfamily)